MKLITQKVIGYKNPSKDYTLNVVILGIHGSRWLHDSKPLHALKSSSKDQNWNIAETRHDATHLRAKISLYEGSRSEQR